MHTTPRTGCTNLISETVRIGLSFESYNPDLRNHPACLPTKVKHGSGQGHATALPVARLQIKILQLLRTFLNHDTHIVKLDRLWHSCGHIRNQPFIFTAHPTDQNVVHLGSRCSGQE